MTPDEVVAGLLFTQPNVQIKGWDNDQWASPVYRVNRVTSTGVVFYGVVGQRRSGWKMSVLSFARDFDTGRKVLTPPESMLI